MTLRFVIDEANSSAALSRREWLRIGGLSAGSLLGARASAADMASTKLKLPGFGRAKSVIVLFASGGQSQLDMWDPKPAASELIRGEFASIATSVSGVRLCEHMPRLAKLARQFTIVRSMSHDDLDHGSATYLSLTGQFHPRKSSNPLPRDDDAPALGAILQRVRSSSQFPYTAVNVNGPLLVPELPSPGQYGGFLGRKFEPLTVGDVTDAAVVLDGLEPQPALPLVRQSGRVSLLDAIDRTRRQFDSDRRYAEMSELYRQAHVLLASPHTRRAFDLSQESAAIRDRYGRYRTGQACLMARRLVEAGVPLITVFLNHTARGQDKAPEETEEYGWDTHNDIFMAMREHLLPRFDVSVSALLEDLEQRGLLRDTLVICMGEFGRAPRIALEPNFAGSTPGRKHWASVYSIMLAGAGVGRGRVVGASDKIAAYPETQPISPGDIAATLFSALGLDPASHFTDPAGRPFPLATGQVVRELFE